MSLLDDIILPGTSRLTASINQQHRQVRKSKSYGGLLSPLVRLVLHPGDTFDGIATTLNNASDASLVDANHSRRQILYLRMKEALNFQEWRAAAMELDQLEGNDAWKEELECAEYNVCLVERRLQELEEARISCDPARMLVQIRTALTRDLGNMGDLRLYKHSHIGTKRLIEQYIDSAQQTLDALLSILSKQHNHSLDSRNVLDQLLAARQAFGRSALLLSGGGTFGMNHIGVVKTLWEHKLLPRIISGASAGSIVCAVLCTKTDIEIPEVLESFCYGDLAVFEKEGDGEGVMTKVARFLKYGSIFDISNLIRVMRDLLGDMTFQEAYNRTRRILNICVSSASIYELPRLLNYVTAPNVIIWSAVAASCSVPFVFSAASLLAKDPKTGKEVPWDPSPQRWIDGSVDNDLPMTRLAEMFNVNHFIVSQVNPHVVPFLKKEEELISAEAQQSTSAFAAGPGWLHSMANLAKDEALHRMHVLAEMGIFPNLVTKARSVLSQRYSGDITIFPEISYAQFPRVLSNPTTEFMLQATIAGERATWPKISRIRNHCAIELALDDAVQKLRTRVVFSPSQVDLRLNTMSRPSSRAGSEKGEKRESSQRRKLSKHKSTHFGSTYNSFPLKDFRFPVTANSVHLPVLRKPTEDAARKFSSSDALSSDADDGLNSTASSDDEDDTTPLDSPPSPLPTLWPSTRPLFPHASQPATPSIARPPVHITPGRPLPLTTSISNVKPAGPSSPELRYKKIFHSQSAIEASRADYTAPDFSDDVPEGPLRSRKSGLDLKVEGG
ncbi:patatin-domain-containing protein [Patellaria atrata CBS 101060]|uniref:Patatin-like phospholipase domain-containing protein n=1 Tax=Patellaria atrata CBS 101060 TaxID=1346257 RepID=A0A9P4VP51_9PEZI|nr:patatin-domain-containing protein [Patellaria atrata CBS 101060]